MRAEPVGDNNEFSAAFWVGAAAEEIVVSQAVLRDGDGVVLQADLAVIVELRNAGGIIRALIVRLLGEQHVIFAELARSRVRILRGSFVPEGEVAFATDEVGAENAAVIAETGQAGFGLIQFILRQRSSGRVVELRSTDGRVARPHMSWAAHTGSTSPHGLD